MRGREGDRHTDTQTDRNRDRETERDRDRLLKHENQLSLSLLVVQHVGLDQMT